MLSIKLKISIIFHSALYIHFLLEHCMREKKKKKSKEIFSNRSCEGKGEGCVYSHLESGKIIGRMSERAQIKVLFFKIPVLLDSTSQERSVCSRSCFSTRKDYQHYCLWHMVSFGGIQSKCSPFLLLCLRATEFTAS